MCYIDSIDVCFIEWQFMFDYYCFLVTSIIRTMTNIVRILGTRRHRTPLADENKKYREITAYLWRTSIEVNSSQFRASCDKEWNSIDINTYHSIDWILSFFFLLKCRFIYVHRWIRLLQIRFLSYFLFSHSNMIVDRRIYTWISMFIYSNIVNNKHRMMNERKVWTSIFTRLEIMHSFYQWDKHVTACTTTDDEQHSTMNFIDSIVKRINNYMFMCSNEFIDLW
jgi:hypothetical protein